MSEKEPPPRNDSLILIAEDSLTQAERLRYTLEQGGYRVIAASNGRQALEQARANKPTLVISDIVMPEMDGYELCGRLKSDSELQDVPVILVTTLSDPQDVIRALECRADNFVVKPYDEQYLLSRIRFLLVNEAMRRKDQPGAGVEIQFNGERHVITADRSQILNLLLSTYDAAIERNKELTRTKDALRSANTALEAANRELEAFSYSVSHDLRAPLRAIEGFSRNLMEDAGDKLDEASRELLERMIAASRRMKQLIDDLLDLSRINRTELHRENVDLSALAESVITDLREREPARRVQTVVAPGLHVQGDPRLLRVALENLLGNAWKFTSKKENALIEVGTIAGAGSSTIFIRDNGAGFDMTYAQRLFGAFQRLHSTSEFPGTGIGLATVQRVMHRHGGRIWAEGEPGVGATFYLTLQP
jgi:two-component system, sensor histidine kinase and response regulator